jgi:hypothetical protein
MERTKVTGKRKVMGKRKATGKAMKWQAVTVHLTSAAGCESGLTATFFTVVTLGTLSLNIP